ARPPRPRPPRPPTSRPRSAPASTPARAPGRSPPPSPSSSASRGARSTSSPWRSPGGAGLPLDPPRLPSLLSPPVKLAATLRGTTYAFRDLRDLLAKANEEKSGDRLAGVAAASAV